ncbi:MAG: hypothetical protein V1652_00005, partial [bacterium]
RAGRWAERKVLTAGAKPEAKKPSFAQKAGTWAANTPGVRAVGGLAVAGAIDKRISTYKSQAEEKQKSFTSLRDDTLLAKANAAGIGWKKDAPQAIGANTAAQAAFANELAKRNLTDKIDPQKLEAFVTAAGKMGHTDDILKNRPDLAPLLGKKIEDTVKKIGKDDIPKVSKVALSNPEVVAHFSDSQLKTLGEKGKGENFQVFQTTLATAVNNDELMKKLSESHRDLKKLQTQIKDSSGEVKNKLSQEKTNLIDKIDKDTNKLSDTQKKIVKNFNKIQENPNFS